MYVIKSWTRDFRDEETRKGDSSCYKEWEYKPTGYSFLGIPIKKRVGKEGTFIQDRVITTRYFKKTSLKFHLYLNKMKFCEDFIEVAYIPDTKEEYHVLEKIALDVIRGKYGNSPERELNLTKAGYNYFKVQSFVNYKMKIYDLFNEKDWEVC